jgi:hypothetical protein
MKKIITTIILIILLSLSYYFFVYLPSKEQKKQNDLFVNNEKCLSYKDGLIQKFEELGDLNFKPYLDQIFYSPKTNSCLYVEITAHEKDPNNGDYTILQNQKLLDMSSGDFQQPLEECLNVESVITECKNFNNKLEEYKK